MFRLKRWITDRYNVYLERTLLMRKNTRRTLRVSYAASNLNVVLVIAGSCLWIAPLYIEDLELSGVLTRSGCGLYTVVTGSLTIGNTYLLTKYIQDIKGVMNRSSDKGAPVSITAPMKRKCSCNEYDAIPCRYRTSLR